MSFLYVNRLTYYVHYTNSYCNMQSSNHLVLYNICPISASYIPINNIMLHTSITDYGFCKKNFKKLTASLNLYLNSNCKKYY